MTLSYIIATYAWDPRLWSESLRLGVHKLWKVAILDREKWARDLPVHMQSCCTTVLQANTAAQTCGLALRLDLFRLHRLMIIVFLGPGDGTLELRLFDDDAAVWSIPARPWFSLSSASMMCIVFPLISWNNIMTDKTCLNALRARMCVCVCACGWVG